MRSHGFILLFFCFMFFNMKAQEYLSKEEIFKKLSVNKNLIENRLQDLNGEYDNYLRLFSYESDEAILYSVVLEKGLRVVYNDEIDRILKNMIHFNPFQNDLNQIYKGEVDYKKQEHILSKILAVDTVMFDFYEKVRRVIDNGYLLLKFNEKESLLALSYFIGHEIIRRTGGRWNIEINPVLFQHVVFIETDSKKKYYPAKLAKDYLELDIPDIEFYFANVEQK